MTYKACNTLADHGYVRQRHPRGPQQQRHGRCRDGVRHKHFDMIFYQTKKNLIIPWHIRPIIHLLIMVMSENDILGYLNNNDMDGVEME